MYLPPILWNVSQFTIFLLELLGPAIGILADPTSSKRKIVNWETTKNSSNYKGMFVNLSWCELEEFSNGAKLGGAAVLRALPLLSPSNAWKKGDPAKIFWKYFQNKWFSWSYKTTNLTEKWRNCWVFWRKSRYFDWFKYGFSITPTEFITYFQNISAGLPFLKSLNITIFYTEKSWLAMTTYTVWKNCERIFFETICKLTFRVY